MKPTEPKHRFTDRIRIDPEKKAYIASIAGEYSMAGKLDEIINFYIANVDKNRQESETANKTVLLPEVPELARITT